MLTKINSVDFNSNWQTPATGLALPLGQTLTFSPDNTFDIGATATTRPRDLFLARNGVIGGTLTLSADPTLALQAATKQYADLKMTQTQADVRYLQLGGGTLTGLLTLSADPSTALQAATKQYADTKLTQTAADARYPLKTDVDPYPTYLTQTEGDARYQTPAQSAALYLPLAGGTLTGNLLFSTDNTRDIGAVAATRPRTIYAATSFIGPGAVPTGGTTGQVLAKTSATDYALSWQAQTGITQAAADLRYLQLSGGTLTGLLTLSADPSTALQAATKQYADTKLTQAQADARYETPAQSAALYLPLAGGTLTGNLLFSADNTRDIGAVAATRPRTIYAATSFVGPGSVPTAGTTGQVLQKNTATNYDVSWVTPSSGGLTQAQADARYLQLTGGTLTGSLLFSADATFDIGASGATRPRDLFLGRNLAVAGTSTLAGAIGIGQGQAVSAGRMVTIGGTLNALTATVLLQPSYGADSAGNLGYGFDASCNTTAAAFTLGGYSAFRANSPFLGAGSAITTVYGFQATNQGKAGVINAYGVYIAAQSGASTLNVGLRNLGTSTLEGQVTIGANATPPFIKALAADTKLLSIESPAGSAYIGGKISGAVNGNAYWDGTNWNRYDTAQAGVIASIAPVGFVIYGSPAGANPMALTTLMAVTPTGVLTLPANGITKPVAFSNLATDIWTNAALAAGYNNVGVSCTGTVDSVNDLVVFNIAVTAQVITSAANLAGWGAVIDGVVVRHGPRIYCLTSGTTYVSWVSQFTVAGGSITAGISGSHTFALYFFVQGAMASGAYLRAGSNGGAEFYQLEVFEVKK